jgi:monothiol glutaredoxin
MSSQDISSRIEKIINDNKVVLFMKGTKEMPMCGFSSMVVAILNKLSVEFQDINILEDNELREGVKIYSNWPTIPQLYILKILQVILQVFSVIYTGYQVGLKIIQDNIIKNAFDRSILMIMFPILNIWKIEFYYEMLNQNDCHMFLYRKN